MELAAIKPIALGLAALLVLGGGIYYFDQNRKRTTERDRATLRADSLMAAKLTLERDTSQLGAQLRAVRTDLGDLNARIEAVNRELSRKSAQLARVGRQNNARAEEAAQLSVDLDRLTAQRDSMLTQLTSLTTERQGLTTQNTQLTRRTDTLSREVVMLNERIRGMAPLSAVTADAFRVEVMKPNDKVTAKAKKADALTVSFTLPMALSGLGERVVNVVLVPAQAQPSALTAVKDLTAGTLPIVVQTTKTVNFGQTPQAVTVQLEPTQRLEPGAYRIIAYAGDTYLGSTEFRLRDSFWFF